MIETNIKSIKIRNLISVLLNAAMFLLVLRSILWFFGPVSTGAGNMEVAGTRCFRFFTNDSNILAAVISLIMIPFGIKSVICGEDAIPRWLLTLKMVGTAAVTLTMAVVLFFLGPMQGYDLMYEGVCLELHLICPLLAIVSFCFFERGLHFSIKRVVWSVVPTLIYGTVYLINVIFRRTWMDFYGFNIGGRWYISYIALPVITFILAFLLCLLHNKFDKKPYSD